MLAAGAVDTENLRLLRHLGMRSLLIVPLTGRNGSFGSVTMIAAESGRRYDDGDVALAEDLAAGPRSASRIRGPTTSRPGESSSCSGSRGYAEH